MSIALGPVFKETASGVKIDLLPEGHVAILAGEMTVAGVTKHFIVSSKNGVAALKAMAEKQFYEPSALLWVMEPEGGLVQPLHCAHCHLYADGGGMIEAGEFCLAIPAPGQEADPNFVPKIPTRMFCIEN